MRTVEGREVEEVVGLRAVEGELGGKRVMVLQNWGRRGKSALLGAHSFPSGRRTTSPNAQQQRRDSSNPRPTFNVAGSLS